MKSILLLVIIAPILRVRTSPVFEEMFIPVSEQGNIVSGLHKEYLSQPIFYESYIPLVLEYQSIAEMNLTEIFKNDNFFQDDVDGDEYDGKESTSSLAQLHFDRLTSSSDFCSKIQPHFNNIYTNDQDFQGYLQSLKRCWMEWELDEDDTKNDTTFLIERNMSDYQRGLKLPLGMEKHLYAVYKKMANSTDSTNQDDPSSSSLKLSLQIGMMGAYYREESRWIHATSDCRQNHLPLSLVTKDKLFQALGNISFINSTSSRFELSLNSSTSISKYYSLPLTDCTHTSEHSLAVRVQIPLVKQIWSKSLQLVQTHIIPFEYQGHVCKIKLNSQFGDHSQENHQSFLYEELSRLAFPTDCKENQLCQISEYSLNTKSLADRCASALFSRNYSVIKNHCQFQCKKMDLTGNPLVTRIHSNQYVLTGSGITISIHCKPKRNEKTNQRFNYIIGSPRIGSHLINLPCNCYFVLKNTERLEDVKFLGEGACSSSISNPYFVDPQVIPIIPFHFSRGKDSHNRNNNYSSFLYETLGQDTKVNLADFLDEQRIFGYLKDSSNAKRSIVSSSLQSNDDVENGSSNVTVLWVIFIATSVFIFGVQAYILYILKRNDRLSYPKDERRLLYKVPDSPVL